MTVADLKMVLNALPDTFLVNLETQGDEKVIRSVSLNCGRLILRDHMLSIAQVVDTVTAFDGQEYVVTVPRVKYPTVIPMPNPIHSQLRNSVSKLNGNDVA